MASSVPDEQKNIEYARADDGEEEAEEEEFSFVVLGEDVVDLFANEERHPVYPVFGQSLLPDDLTSSFRELSVEEGERGANASSGQQDGLGLPADSYCDWKPQIGTPPLDANKKSRSTGTSSSRKWKLMDLVVGRSRSDGKEKFLFLAPPNTTPAERKKAVARKAPEQMDMKTAHELYYGKPPAGDRKQPSYLPYRQRLVGFRPF